MIRRSAPRSSLARVLGAAGLLLALCAAACVSSAAYRTGSTVYPPLPPNAPVAVYFDERDVGRPFQVVGEVDVDNPGKYQILTVQDAIPDLTSQAASIGANGIIVDSSGPVKSGIISTGVYARARAIRVLDAAPPGAVIVPVAPTSATVVMPAAPAPAVTVVAPAPPAGAVVPGQ
jgi:hypothetical protein